MEPETVSKLSYKKDNIVGIKCASGDIDQITKACSNILRNAIDSIEHEGEVRVSISGESSEGNKTPKS